MVRELETNTNHGVNRIEKNFDITTDSNLKGQFRNSSNPCTQDLIAFKKSLTNEFGPSVLEITLFTLFEINYKCSSGKKNPGGYPGFLSLSGGQCLLCAYASHICAFMRASHDNAYTSAPTHKDKPHSCQLSALPSQTAQPAARQQAARPAPAARLAAAPRRWLTGPRRA
jgi:hypothetical protein